MWGKIVVVFVISGKNATGKTEISKYLENKYNFERIEIRGLLKELFPNKPDFAQKLYSIKKDGVLEVVLPTILKKVANNKNLIIEGILSTQEVILFKKHIPDFNLIYFSSNKDIRLERVILRTKNKKQLEFINPMDQIKRSDYFRINLMGVEELKTIADLVVVNNSNKKQSFFTVTESGLKKMFIKKIINILKKRIKSKKKFIFKSNQKLRAQKKPIKVKLK